MLRVRVADGEREAIDAAVAVLRSGGIVAYPTDTLYGLAVDPRRDDAVERLFGVKGRELTAAIPLIAGRFGQAAEVAVLGEPELRLARAFWPGPLSIVAPARRTVSRLVLGGGDSVAVRFTDHSIAAGLAVAFGFCLTATSANLSGSPATADPDVVWRRLEGRIELVVDAGHAPGGLPSTIVEIRAGMPVLVRAGAVAWDRVLRSLE